MGFRGLFSVCQRASLSIKGTQKRAFYVCHITFSLFDNERDEHQIIRPGVADAVSAAIVTEKRITGVNGTLRAVVAVYALAGDDGIGFGFAVVLMIVDLPAGETVMRAKRPLPPSRSSGSSFSTFLLGFSPFWTTPFRCAPRHSTS